MLGKNVKSCTKTISDTLAKLLILLKTR